MQSTTEFALPTREGVKNRLFRLVAAWLTGLALLLGFSLPAQAHDVLVNFEIVPQTGDSTQAVQLTFNNSIIGVGTEILLTDKNGKEVTLATPAVSGPTVTQDLPADLAPATYQIAWRVVSSDGHPIEGNLWVTTSQNGKSEITDKAPAGFRSSTNSQTEKSPAANGAKEQASQLPLPQLLLLGGGAIVVLAIAVVAGAKLANRGSKK